MPSSHRRERHPALGASLGLLLALAAPAKASGLQPAPPADPAHPGSAIYPHAAIERTRFVLKDSIFGAGYLVTVRAPRGASGRPPLVVFAHGKALWFTPSLYGGLLDHLARKGAIVADVEYEGYLAGALSTDHERFARRLLRGMTETLRRFPQADERSVFFAGHSLGARVALIAAALATAGDPRQHVPDPTALVLHAFDDSRPPTGAARPAVLGAGGIARDVGQGVEVTIVEYAADAIAGPQTRYAERLYDELRVARKQWIRARSAPTAPPISADHLAPLSGGPSWTPGGSAPVTDALDRHLVWKITAGVVLARSGIDARAAPYAYGALREDGGTTSTGSQVLHAVIRQSF